MTRQQSASNRQRRLTNGCCPIHGIPMAQVSEWEERKGGALDGALVAVVECPRRDCDIKAYAADIDGPWELLPEFQHLLAGVSPSE